MIVYVATFLSSWILIKVFNLNRCKITCLFFMFNFCMYMKLNTEGDNFIYQVSSTVLFVFVLFCSVLFVLLQISYFKRSTREHEIHNYLSFGRLFIYK